MWIHELDGLRASLSNTSARTNRVAQDLIRAQLKVADSLISVAETTCRLESGVRNVRNAWRALNGVEQFARKVNFEVPERERFRDVHSALCLRLANLRTRSQD